MSTIGWLDTETLIFIVVMVGIKISLKSIFRPWCFNKRCVGLMEPRGKTHKAYCNLVQPQKQVVVIHSRFMWHNAVICWHFMWNSWGMFSFWSKSRGYSCLWTRPMDVLFQGLWVVAGWTRWVHRASVTKFPLQHGTCARVSRRRRRDGDFSPRVWMRKLILVSEGWVMV